jgi:2-polyprenyl-3-methyl-5-hydroxy-6-metoxy-1,4-benzoquinol methylase
MNLESQIQKFYGEIKFPGLYTLEDFKIYDGNLFNQFLVQFEQAIQNRKRVLDIGCGSGMIVNLLAYRNPDIQFDAVDFSDSIDFAQEFSTKHNIQNVMFHKINFFKFQSKFTYDAIICNGVLHHIPDYSNAVTRIDQLLESKGKLIIGLYNPYGKLAKKLFSIKYVNQILFLDQEKVPFELTFNYKQVKLLFNQYTLEKVYPSVVNKLVDLINLFNYNNGGLTIYTFKKI